MAKYKLCPMSFNLNDHSRNCIKEKCAWWDVLAGDCAVVVIAKLGLEGSFNAIHKEVRK